MLRTLPSPPGVHQRKFKVRIHLPVLPMLVPAPTQPPLSPDQPRSPCSVHSEPLPALCLQNTGCGYNDQATQVLSVQSPSPQPDLAAQMSEGPEAAESPSCADWVALGTVLGVLSLSRLTCTVGQCCPLLGGGGQIQQDAEGEHRLFHGQTLRDQFPARPLGSSASQFSHL